MAGVHQSRQLTGASPHPYSAWRHGERVHPSNINPQLRSCSVSRCLRKAAHSLLTLVQRIALERPPTRQCRIPNKCLDATIRLPHGGTWTPATMRACDAARVWAPSHVDAASLNVVRRATRWSLAFQTRDIAGRGVLVLIPAAYEYVVEDKMKSSGVSMLRMSLAGSHTVHVAIARRGAHVESTATCINIPDISLFTLRVP